MSIFDDIPTRSNANDDFVEASWWNIIKQKLQEAFPNVTAVTGDVVGTTDEQTLTNKTFDDELTLKELTGTISTPDTGYKKVYPKDDGKLYSLNSDGDEVEIGSGGEGGKNYFDQDSAKFEGGNIGSWETDDGAGSAATGLTLSATQTVGEVLEKTTSLKLVKAAADHDGEFIKLASQTIDPIDRGKQLFGSFAFKPISGYVSGDLILEIYDLTNSAVLYSGASEDLELLNVTDPITFNYNAYLESTTAQIELRLKVNNTNTNTFTITFDEFKFGPASVLPAVAMTEWESFTPSGSWTSNTTYTGYKRRVGDTEEYSIEVTTSGAPNSATLSINIPGGKSIDTAKINADTEDFALGTVSIHDNGSALFLGRVSYLTPTTVGITYHTTSASPANVTQAAPMTFASGDEVFIKFSVPISGWKASSTMTTNELGLQRVTASGAGNGGTSLTASVTNIDFTEVSDPFNAWSGTVFTTPRTAKYKFNGFVQLSTAGSIAFRSFVNGSSNKYASYLPGTSQFAPFNWEGVLNKGDTWSLRSDNSQTLGNSTSLHWIEISSQEDLTLIGAVRNDEYLEDSLQETATGLPTAGEYGDVAQLTLSPGTWDLGYTAALLGNSGDNSLIIGLGTTSGNNAPNLDGNSSPLDLLVQNGNFSTNGRRLTAFLDFKNYKVNTTTTVYAKWQRATSASTQWGGKLSARRIK